MKKKDKEFYVWTMGECVKGTYEEWGIDMMSMYGNIKKDFPNVTKAIHEMYSTFKDEKDCYQAEPLAFESPKLVYEAVANLIPLKKLLKFDLSTKNKSGEYEYLNICSFDKFVPVERIDLIMAVLLFAEEFILEPITNENVSLTDTEFSVEGTFVNLEVSKTEEETHICIEIKDVIILQYVMLN